MGGLSKPDRSAQWKDEDASVISALDQLIIDAKPEMGLAGRNTAPLQPGNGRDHLRDWWSAMDGIAYALLCAA